MINYAIMAFTAQDTEIATTRIGKMINQIQHAEY